MEPPSIRKDAMATLLSALSSEELEEMFVKAAAQPATPDGAAAVEVAGASVPVAAITTDAVL